MKKLSDKENSDLNNTLDELKRRVHHGNLDCNKVINISNQMIHQNRLSTNIVDAILSHPLYNYTADPAILIANILDLRGFIVCLEECHRIGYFLTSFPVQEGERKRGMITDIRYYRATKILKDIKVSWEVKKNNQAVFNISIDSELGELQADKLNYMRAVGMLAFQLKRHPKFEHAAITENDSIYVF